MNARILFLGAALVAGCSSAPLAPSAKPSGAPVGPASFYPLAIGNEWVWDDVSPQLAEGGRKAARTVRIVSRTSDGFFRDTDGAELRADGECVRDRVRRLLCTPLTVGSGWKSVVSISSTERYEIMGVAERIETPAGTFDGCVRVRAHNRAGPTSEHVMELTYAPGVGPVRLETWAIVDGVAAPQVRAVLRSFRSAR
jgi:hypothetical protein